LTSDLGGQQLFGMAVGLSRALNAKELLIDDQMMSSA
jgi:hypothetical protein